MKIITLCIVCLNFLLAANTLQAQEPSSYARHVRPFLAKYCIECHNAKELKGGLDLESFKSMLEGSERGPVLVPGKPDESKLATLLDGKTKPVMPPQKVKIRPSKAEIALVRAWIKAGAKDDSQLVKTAIPHIAPRKTTPAPVTALGFRQQELCVVQARKLACYRLQGDDSPSAEFEPPGSPDGARITALAVSAHKLTVVAHGRPGEPSILHLLEPGKETSIRSGHKDSVLGLAVSPDGKVLASCSYDAQIKLWSLGSGKELHTLKEHSDAVYAVAFSPDGKLLASCSADRTVKLWDTASGSLLYTLSDATDWLYALAFSPDGKFLASGGVDKSIRVYTVAGPNGATLVHSVFAHEGPVLKLVYAADNRALYSVGQDAIVKAWDPLTMVEKRVFERQPETVLDLAVDADNKRLALGRYDGVVVILDVASGKVLRQLAPSAAAGPKTQSSKEDASVYGFPVVQQHETSRSRAGQNVALPATIDGSLARAGETDCYRFDVPAGFQLGVHLVPIQPGPAAKKDKAKVEFEPILQVVDEKGRVLAESGAGLLGCTFADKGTYVLSVRDREYRGGMPYRLHLGDIPVVSATFPMGLMRGSSADIQLDGVHLGVTQVRVKAPADAMPGDKISLGISTKRGTPLGIGHVVVGEFPETSSKVISVPGTANGRLPMSGGDIWKFQARKGQQLLVEVEARRLGSLLDSFIEILDAEDRPVPRAVLRCQAKTHVTFRDHDSRRPGIRIETWGDLAVNDYLMVGGELLRIKSLPTHPDDDCQFFSEGGQRLGFLETTPMHISMGMPMYKVSLHPPGTTFAPNGFPVLTLYYRNDDGGPGYGRDSRLFFDPPADGEYRIRIQDARGQGGPNHGYRLTVRSPRPSFEVRFSPTNPVVSRGGAQSINVNVDRKEGYDGPIHLQFTGVPPGFSMPAQAIIGPFDTSTAVALYAGPDAATAKQGLKMLAHAMIDGRKVVKELAGSAVSAVDPGDLLTFTQEEEITLKPGGQTRLTVAIERRNGFAGRVPVKVMGLPHGVRVLDVGLNGILITEQETRRTMVLYAEPWVEATSQPFVVLAQQEAKKTDHAARSVMLNVR